jgi:hypothetical protein
MHLGPMMPYTVYWKRTNVHPSSPMCVTVQTSPHPANMCRNNYLSPPPPTSNFYFCGSENNVVFFYSSEYRNTVLNLNTIIMLFVYNKLSVTEPVRKTNLRLSFFRKPLRSPCWPMCWIWRTTFILLQA